MIGSEDRINIGGEAVIARQYPWGVVEVDNPDHCDFIRLKDAILGSHLNDLKEITHDFLYENYRTEKLSRGMPNEYAPDASLASEDLANQSMRLKEDQLRREEEKLREIELRVQREIMEKRQELLAKEESLRSLETRLKPTA